MAKPKKTAAQIVAESRKELVDEIIQKMKNGVSPVKEMWDSTKIYGLPYNPVSGAKYQGINLMRLLIASVHKGYEDPRWMTIKQANKHGYRIKRGAKSELLEKWVWTKIVEEENEEGELEKKIVKLKKPYVNFFRVFNAEQIEGVEPIPKVVPMKKNEMLQLAEEVIASSKCEIREEMQNNAYYSPKEDRIILPPRDYFKSQEAFLAVVLHEMGHSTGHPDRLNRPLMNKFGTPEYAKEELNAEFASAFLQMDLGIRLSDETVNDHAAYLQSWISVLEDDPNELFRAVHNASEISDYLIESYQEYQETQKVEEEKISQIQEDELSISGNATLRVAIKRALRVGNIDAGLALLEKSSLRHPNDVEGNQLVKEKYLEHVQNFLSDEQEKEIDEKVRNEIPEEIQTEAEMLGYSVEELQNKIQDGMPKKSYDIAALINETAKSLSGNYKAEKLWESTENSLIEDTQYDQSDMLLDNGNLGLEIETDLELEI